MTRDLSRNDGPGRFAIWVFWFGRVKWRRRMAVSLPTIVGVIGKEYRAQ